MTGLNHAVTGAVIATAVKNPAIALPAALLSHFVVDVLPHWDYKLRSATQLGLIVRLLDLSLSLALLVALSLTTSTAVVFLAGFLAILPDFMWWNFFLHGKPDRADTNSLLHILRRFHLKIQRSETGAGILFELVWFVVMVIIFFYLV
jgi:hypothetical protein